MTVMTDGRIVVAGLTKRYGALTAVDDLSFTVEAGRVTGVRKDPSTGCASSDTSEQNGFATLIKGVFGTLQKPARPHDPVTGAWNLSEADALDLFSMLSFVHRRLDQTRVTPHA